MILMLYVYSSTIMSCRLHRYPWPSLAISPYRSSLPAGLQGCIPNPHIAAVCMYVRAGRPAFARPYVGAHWSTSLLSSSLLLQQCHACLVRLTWIVFVMGGRWPYSWCFVGCCCQDSFNIARNILVLLPSSFFSSRFVSVQVVHPYRSIDTTAAWKKLRFILLVRLDLKKKEVQT